ncbi:centrosomal protein of 162 kDa isoform X1 [Protopterus annectens]|uniref:centrosomal protein of 162 kDa isoform X1 n=1 Tax=Protopterus annectens TaxID=7888 RepID=UPI001CF9AAA2|nr:centrosomal protein of 162 kDa isoform X1 [Protopterus annectens]
MAYRLSKEELDEQFEQFLKESVSDDSFELGSSRKAGAIDDNEDSRKNEVNKKESKPWWMTEDAERGGITGPGRSFMKYSKASQPIAEVDEEEMGEKTPFERRGNVSVSMSKDSLETEDSVLAAGPVQSYSGFGMDTLEEQEEKERFFANLEKGASSTIDYSKLNKELDLSDSPPHRMLIGNIEKEQGGETVESTDNIRNKGTPASLEYSEDFEEVGEASFDAKDKETHTEEEVKIAPNVDVHKQGEEKTSTSMLAKVLLLDSMESTGGTQKLFIEHDSMEDEKKQESTMNNMTGVSYGQTNSDLEALHQAYHHIDQSLEDTGSRKRILSGETGRANYFEHDGPHSSIDGPCNVSAVESDLPTIEEMMKHVQGESAFPRGFDLQPVSEFEVAVEEPPEISDKLQQDHRRSSISEQEKEDHHPKSHKKEVLTPQDSVEGESATVKGSFQKQDDLMSRRNSDTWQNEVFGDSAVIPQNSRNLKDLKHPAYFWDNNPNYSKVPDQPAVHKKTWSPRNKTRKPQTSHYASVKSSGYGKVSPPTKQPLSGTLKDSMKKMLSKNKSPQDQAKDKFKVNKAKQSGGGTVTFASNESCVKSSDHLLKSVQLYSSYLEHELSALKETSQMQVGKQPQLPDSSEVPMEHAAFSPPSGKLQREHSLLLRVHEVEDRWREEHNLAENLTAELLVKEKELHRQAEDMKLQYENDLDQLKKENYLLQTKLHSLEEANQKRTLVFGKTNDKVTQEKLLEFEREIREQETLIHGYHQENEKLYRQVKELQAKNKQIEENAFRENQRLMTEVATLKEQISKSNLQQPGPKDNEQARNLNFTELLSELRAAQKEEARFMEEIRRLKQEKQSLEVDFEQMKKQRDLAKAQAVYTSGDKAFEMKILEETYKQEISRLNKRLQWYAENQELLDKDATRLKTATAETEKLKQLVDKLQAEVGDRTLQQQKRFKDRAADAKRIQDLERQVKEMEEIIRRRHPNSLPALIYAAASVPVTEGEVSNKPSSVTFLEKRVKKLESELEGKDEEAKKGLRALEQQYQKVKIQYENRIAELEQLLSHRHPSAAKKPSENVEAVKAFEQEKHHLIETHQATVANLHREVQRLRDLLAQAELKIMEKECLKSKKADAEQINVNSRMDKLSQELIMKNKEIQELTRTVERLQKERRTLLSEQRSPRDRLNTRHKLSKKVGKDDAAVNSKIDFKDKDPFPSTSDEKLYQPTVFAGSHISEVLQENEKLKSELRQLSLDADQQRVQLHAAVAKAEQDARRATENAVEHVSTLKAAHQRELETILTQHALEHSSSKVAELTSKISTQEVVIKHLREQVTELQKGQEALAVTKVQQETLQSQIIKLLEELREAKEKHSPEMKHFLALEKKIQNMEFKHSQREQELQQIIYQTQQRTGAEWVQEVEKWKLLAQKKNQELENFRMELDSILDILRELQRQGVVIPVPMSTRTNIAGFTWNT